MNGEAVPFRTWHALPGWFRKLAAERRGSVLLETAKFDGENYRSLLFLDPVCELTANSREEVRSVLQEVEEHLAQGRFVAGFFSYECGEVLHGISPDAYREAQRDLPLIGLGVFEDYVVFDHRDGSVTGDATDAERGNSSQQSAQVLEAVLNIKPEEYARKIRRVQEFLADGHSYQVNFTDRVTGTFAGLARDLYASILAQQPVSYAAYLHREDCDILSFSPELFYRVAEQELCVRPMKGTWPRGVNHSEDEVAAEHLRSDAKNCAEHVTIVDLLRNDMGKICEAGSVRADKLMQVEQYRTLHQMTSTICGRVLRDKTATQVFEALFPSGSITGAPKRRTMEIIRELEQTNRGIYTGAIGWFGPEMEACFNVAIRTLRAKDERFTLGVGGGITADSDPETEYEECRLKSSFLTKREAPFHLIETMRASGGRIALLDSHLERMRGSAAYFQIDFCEEEIRRDIDLALKRSGVADSRARLTLEQSGCWEFRLSALEATAWTGKVLLCSKKTCAADVFLHHKTSNRKLYDEALLEARTKGFDEVFFSNEDGLLTEGAISNIFLLREGEIVTPATECGVLPGVERGRLLAEVDGSRSAMISLPDMLQAESIWVCSGLRGVRRVTAVHDERGECIWQEASTPEGSAFSLRPDLLTA